MSNSIEGKVLKVSDVITVSDKFKKRLLLIETDGQYPQKIKFEFHQDRVDLLNEVQTDHMYKVSFDIRGNEWEGKVYNNLVAWKIEHMSHIETPPIPSTQQEVNELEKLPW